MYLLMPFFFLLVFSLLIWLFNKKTYSSLELKTTFESGFEPKQTFRPYFSLRYFNLTIIFLLFDMEIVFLMPLPFFYSQMINLIFCIYMLLILGTYLEWNQGGLDWK